MKLSQNFIPTESATHTPLKGYTSASNITSDPIFLERVDQFALTAFWTGGGTGTFTLQGCTDEERVQGQAVVNGVSDTYLANWVTIGTSSTASSVGSPIMWNFSNVGYRWVRLVYTTSGGSITLSVTVQLKGLG